MATHGSRTSESNTNELSNDVQSQNTSHFLFIFSNLFINKLLVQAEISDSENKPPVCMHRFENVPNIDRN